MWYCRYQTGALTPLMRWVSQAMHRAAAPPRPLRPAAMVEPIVRQGDDNAAVAAAGGNLLLVFLYMQHILSGNC